MYSFIIHHKNCRVSIEIFMTGADSEKVTSQNVLTRILKFQI
ncbi:unnamed protein product [Tenebrio molitor]|nr:unnamed protein product [Tenebrio molitor]